LAGEGSSGGEVDAQLNKQNGGSSDQEEKAIVESDYVKGNKR
jgi:hypothetical protein